jgi:NAD(P)H-hydrate epimerase
VLIGGYDTGMPALPEPLVLTREQVRRVDQIAIEQFHVPGIVLMENAARGVVRAIYNERLSHQNVLILCGGGNNGGDGLAIARHLHNAGSHVTVGLCTNPAKYTGDALINWRIVQAMKLPTINVTTDWLKESHRLDAALGPDGLSVRRSLIIDAIFGTGLAAPPREPFPQIVEAIERWAVPVVAVDLPSGLDCDTAEPLGPRAIHATLTVTFVGMKKGFLTPGAETYTGKIVVADIGCPWEAIAEARRSP